jgi:predicted nucleic acid-binding protein
MTLYFLDTNVLFWYLVKTSKHHVDVVNCLDPLLLNVDNTFIINEIVVMELLHLLVKKNGKDGYSIGNLLLSGNYSFLDIKFDILGIADLRDILEDLFKYGVKTTIGGRDSSILHSITKYKVDCLITNDSGFDGIAGLRRCDPIAPIAP